MSDEEFSSEVINQNGVAWTILFESPICEKFNTYLRESSNEYKAVLGNTRIPTEVAFFDEKVEVEAICKAFNLKEGEWVPSGHEMCRVRLVETNMAKILERESWGTLFELPRKDSLGKQRSEPYKPYKTSTQVKSTPKPQVSMAEASAILAAFTNRLKNSEGRTSIHKS